MSDSLCTVKTLDGSQESGIIYKEKYLATEDGRIFTFKEKQNRWRQQKARPHTNGYLRVVINRKDEYVHRIIAFCFNDNPRGCKEVRVCFQIRSTCIIMQAGYEYNQDERKRGTEMPAYQTG